MPYCKAHSPVPGSFLVCDSALWCIADTLTIDSLLNSVKSLSLSLTSCHPQLLQLHASTLFVACGVRHACFLLPSHTVMVQQIRQTPQNKTTKKIHEILKRGIDLGYHGTLMIFHLFFRQVYSFISHAIENRLTRLRCSSHTTPQPPPWRNVSMMACPCMLSSCACDKAVPVSCCQRFCLPAL